MASSRAVLVALAMVSGFISSVGCSGDSNHSGEVAAGDTSGSSGDDGSSAKGGTGPNAGKGAGATGGSAGGGKGGSSVGGRAAVAGRGGTANGGSSSDEGGAGATDSGGSRALSGAGGGATLDACLSDMTCRPLHELCDQVARVCVGCVADTDCSADEACVDSACTAAPGCQNSLDCDVGTVCVKAADASSGHCRECGLDADCSGGGVCRANICRAGCSSDTECRPSGLICAAGACSECAVDADCDADATCEDYRCHAAACTPGTGRCVGNVAVPCNRLGSGFGAPMDCGDFTCDDSQGAVTCNGAADGCTTAPADYCAGLPHFDAGTQVVDGDGAEFCNLPATSGAVASLWVNPAYTETALPARYTIRAAWSTSTFSAHVHVEDPSVVPDSSDQLWNGDTVQLYVASYGDLKGSYGIPSGESPNEQVTHIIVSPPSAGYPSGRAVLEASDNTFGPARAGTFASRLVPDGYEVEVELPWAGEAAGEVFAGDHVGFDFSITDKDETDGPLLDGVYANTLSISAACNHPWCDDRGFCLPVLE